VAFRTWLMAAACGLVLASTPLANASAPLTSISVFNGGGFAPCSQIGPVEILIGHDPVPYVSPYFIVDYGHGLRMWNQGDSGQFDISPANEPRFSDLAAILTNGTDNMIWFLSEMNAADPTNSGVGGCGGPESIVFPTGHDLAGNQLDFIRLYVANVNIEVLNPETHWVAWTADVTYEFWGTPLPEPAMAMPLLCASLLLRRKARSRRNQRLA
jgi:hypothetical protein